jgi:spore coat protein U-like protein
MRLLANCRSSLIRSALAILAAYGVGSAQAGTATTTFNVTADVGSACSVTAADLNFGTYLSSDAVAKTGTTTVTVTCSLATVYNVGLDAGVNGGTIAVRKMKITGGGTDTLNYTLGRDAAGLQNWGNTSGTDTTAGVGTGLGVPHVVYGSIAAAQNVPIGHYTDVITATVYY